MSTYSKVEETRSRWDAKKRQILDEEGFVTVTKGAYGGVVRMADAKKLGEKTKDEGQRLGGLLQVPNAREREGRESGVLEEVQRR
jgi:hypothetical protein